MRAHILLFVLFYLIWLFHLIFKQHHPQKDYDRLYINNSHLLVLIISPMSSAFRQLERRLLHFLHCKRTIRNARAYNSLALSVLVSTVIFTAAKKNTIYYKNYAEHLKNIYDIISHTNPFYMTEHEWDKYTNYVMEFSYR